MAQLLSGEQSNDDTHPTLYHVSLARWLHIYPLCRATEILPATTSGHIAVDTVVHVADVVSINKRRVITRRTLLYQRVERSSEIFTRSQVREYRMFLTSLMSALNFLEQRYRWVLTSVVNCV